MEQTLGWKELCVQTLPAGIRFVISLSEYVPVEIVLGLAVVGSLFLLFVVAYLGRALGRNAFRLIKTRLSSAGPAPIPSKDVQSPRKIISPRPATPKVPVIIPSPRPDEKVADESEPRPVVGIYTFFKPGPPTPPATARRRSLRPRGKGREASLPSGIA